MPLSYLFLCTIPAAKLSDSSFWLSSCPVLRTPQNPQICCHYSVATPKGTGMNIAKAAFSSNQGHKEIMSDFQLASPFSADSAKLLPSDKALANTSLERKKHNYPTQNFKDCSGSERLKPNILKPKVCSLQLWCQSLTRLPSILVDGDSAWENITTK